jgi:hypothetical protein
MASAYNLHNFISELALQHGETVVMPVRKEAITEAVGEPIADVATKLRRKEATQTSWGGGK